MSIYSKTAEKNQLFQFLKVMNDKYLPEEIQIHFSITNHFIERLVLDRSDNLNKKWLSLVFTKVFKQRLGELLYLVHHAKHKDRINFVHDSKTIGMVLEHHEGYLAPQLRVTTCFTGVAKKPGIKYYVISLDEEVKNEET